jgi:hypothetical protein
MGTVRRSVFAAFTAAALTGAFVHAASTGAASLPLFSADFDASSGQVTASLGTINSYFTPAAVKLTADSSGNKLAIDDTYTVSGLPTAVACWFKDNHKVESGIFEFSYETTVSTSHLPFQTGIVIDAPQSDMIPATGPDDAGILLIGGVATNVVIPPDAELIVVGSFSRASKSEDWLYDIAVELRNPPAGEEPFLASMEGRATNTAGASITGIAFRKLSGEAGVATIDDVNASYVPPSQAAKKR